jgi:Large polyvalent protein associated domain 38
VAQYEFKAPDGKTYLFKGPSGLTQSDVNLFGKNYFGVEEPQIMPAPVEKKAETGFIPSVKRGAAQTGMLLGDILPAMVGKAVGADEYAAQQMQEAAKTQEEIAKKYPAEVSSYTDIKGIGDALVYAKEAIGEALPSLIPSLFTGGAASILGRGAVAAAQSAAEKVVMTQAAKGLVGEELKQAATKAGIQAARQTALKYEAGGALAGSAAQNIPDVYQNIYEATGKEDLGTAIAFGSFNSVLDAITPVALLRKAKLSGIGPEELGAAWYKRAGTGAVKGFVTEGGTEALQEVSSATAESFVDENREFFTPQNFERFINAGLKGGLGGAGITSVADVALGKGPETAPEAEKIKTKGLADVEVPTGTDLGPEPELAPTAVQRTVSGFEISPEGEAVAPVPTGAPATEVDLLVQDFNRRAEDIKVLQAKKQNGVITPAEAVTLTNKTNKQRRVGYQIESLQATQKGAPDVRPIDTPAGGASVPVAKQPDPVVPTEGLEKPDGLGVVPARPDVVQPAPGEGEQQASVEERIKFLENELVDWSLVGKRPEDDPRVQAIADELAALKSKQVAQPNVIEESEDVPDFVVSYNPAATQKEIDEISATLQDPTLGLRQREALEERLDELLARQTTEEAPTEETLVEEEIPAIEVAPEQREMYDETREYHNGIEPDTRLHLPEFDALAPEQQQVYFEALTDNSQVAHDVAAEKLSGYLAETQGVKPKNVPKTKPLPKFIEDQLDKNNATAFLNYLRTSAQDPVHRAIAQALYKLKLDTKVEIVKGLPNNRPAEYDPKTDTVRVTKEGQTETVLLHEFAHAGTIRVLNNFEESTGRLSQKQEDGAVHLDYLMGKTQPLLGKKYPAAYKNVYEFVSYAVTDRAFQKELQRIQIPASDSLWGQVKDALSNFVKAVAQVLGIPDTVEARNALIETFGAFEYVMSVPKGGIQMDPLPTETKQAETYDESTLSDEQLAAQAESEVQLKEHTAKSFLRNLFTKKGGHWAATMFQNERYPIKVAEDRARLFGLLKRIGPDLNNVYGQITSSAGMAVNLYDEYLRNATEETHAAVEAYAKKSGLTINEALGRLHIILEARHEPERRRVKYIKTVPLENDSKRIKFEGKEYSAEGFREAVMRDLAQPSYPVTEDMTQDQISKLDEKRKERALDLRAMLDKVVDDKTFHAKQINGKPTAPEMFNQNNAMYNVIANRTPRQIAAILKERVTPQTEKEVEAVVEALRKVNKQTQTLNKIANYHSQPASNVIDFYSFKDYVPFKGRPGFRQIDEEFNIDSRRIGGDLQEGQNPFGGRESESENPLLQSLADGASAAMRAGRKDLTLAIKNAVKDKLLIGRVKDKIKFEDRFLGNLDKKDIGGDNKIFHYNADGTIDVVELNDPKQREAIRRSYRTTQPLIDIANSITSGIGQMHTRYNPAFAPMNFVRDALTNAFTLGAEFGPAKAGQLLTSIAADVAGGGMAKSMRFSNLYANGKFDKLKELAAKDQYYADLLDYIQLGGKVSYLQGLAAKGALDGLMKEIGRSGILRKKDQVDKFIDIYNDMFELSSRAATYRMLKDQFFAENKSSGKFKNDADALADAKSQAVEYAKNLANFEQVGRWGKGAGALFMFFRPAATGAVRAIEALAPAFRLLPPGIGGFDEAAFREEAVAQGRTPEQIDNAVKQMMQEAKNSAYMATSLIGTGVAMYYMALMMAEEDDQGRNKVVTDDMARWTRYARFHIPGTDVIIQIPWGFGLGAFASAGAQIASIASGRTSLLDAFGNIMVTGLDSFMPLPISRISPIDNFPAFAMDSVTPSMFRPFFEYVMNLDGLGRQIYNNRQSRFGDAYTGGDNIPEIYKKAARELFDATNGAVDWSPNTMYFFANNYFDGIAKMASSATNVGLTVAGAKEFDPKNDMVFISSFIGSKSNIDAREFSSIEKQVKRMEQRINSLKDRPEQLEKFMEDNPTAYPAVQFYNMQVNGTLRQIRAAANQVRANKDLTIMERKEQLKQLNDMSSLVKHRLVEAFDMLDVKP